MALVFSPADFTSGLERTEAKLTFNGLTLNDRYLADTYFVSEIDWGDPDIRDSKMPIPGTHGEFIGKQFFGGRTMTLSGYIRAGNRAMLRKMENDLRAALASNLEHDLFITGMTAALLRISCRKASSLALKPSNRGMYFCTDFQFSLRASDPRFRAYTPSNTSITFSAGGTGTCTNGGNWWAEPVLRLGNAATSVTDPVVVNSTLNLTLAFTGVITGNATTWTELGLRAVDRYCVDQAGAVQWAKVDPASAFWALQPGVNNITVNRSAQTGSPTVSITWYDSWI